MFPKAKLKRFNDIEPCGPPPTAYDPRFPENGKIPSSFGKGQRFKEGVPDADNHLTVGHGLQRTGSTSSVGSNGRSSSRQRHSSTTLNSGEAPADSHDKCNKQIAELEKSLRQLTAERNHLLKERESASAARPSSPDRVQQCDLHLQRIQELENNLHDLITEKNAAMQTLTEQHEEKLIHLKQLQESEISTLNANFQADKTLLESKLADMETRFTDLLNLKDAEALQVASNHARALEELRLLHELQISEQERSYNDEKRTLEARVAEVEASFAACKDEREAEMQQITSEHLRQLEELSTVRQSQISQLHDKHTEEKRELQAQISKLETQFADFSIEKELEKQELVAKLTFQLEDLGQQHQMEITQLQSQHYEEKSALQARVAEVEACFAAWRDEKEAEIQQVISGHLQQLEELSTVHQSQMSQLEDKHNEEKRELQAQIPKLEAQFADFSIEKELEKQELVAKLTFQLEDLGQQHQMEVTQLQTQHYEEKSALQARLENANNNLDELIVTNEVEMEQIKADHEHQIQTLIQNHTAEKEKLISDFRQQLSELASEKDARMAAEILKLSQEHESLLRETTEKHLKVLEDLLVSHQNETSSLTRLHEEVLAQTEQKFAEIQENLHLKHSEEVKEMEEDYLKKLEVISKELLELQTQFNEEQSTWHQLQKTLESNLESSARQISNLETEKKSLENCLGAAQVEIEGKISTLEILTAEKNRSEQNLQQLASVLKQKEDFNNELTNNFENEKLLWAETERQLKKEVNSLEFQLKISEEKLEETTTSLESELEAAKTLQSELKNQIVVLESAKADLEDEVKKFINQEKIFQEQISLVESANTQLRASLESALQKTSSLDAEILRMEGAFTNEKTSLLEKNEILEREVSTLKEDWRSQTTVLESQLAKCQADLAYKEAVAAKLETRIKLLTEDHEKEQQKILEFWKSQISQHQLEHEERVQKLRNQVEKAEKCIKDLQDQLEAKEKAVEQAEEQLQVKTELFQQEMELLKLDKEEAVSLAEQKFKAAAHEDSDKLRKALADLESLRKKYAELEQLIEPFRAQLDMYEAEKNCLLRQTQSAESDFASLASKYADLMGHQNQKQKIKHLMKLKDDNASLRSEVAELRLTLEKEKKSRQAAEKKLTEAGLNRKFNPENAFKVPVATTTSAPIATPAPATATSSATPKNKPRRILGQSSVDNSQTPTATPSKGKGSATFKVNKIKSNMFGDQFFIPMQEVEAQQVAFEEEKRKQRELRRQNANFAVFDVDFGPANSKRLTYDVPNNKENVEK